MKAKYFNDTTTAPVVMEVVRDNNDGTVDLAHSATSPAVVTRCPVLVAAQEGCCMLVHDDGKAANAEAEARANAEAEARAKGGSRSEGQGRSQNKEK